MNRMKTIIITAIICLLIIGAGIVFQFWMRERMFPSPEESSQEVSEAAPSQEEPKSQAEESEESAEPSPAESQTSPETTPETTASADRRGGEPRS